MPPLSEFFGLTRVINLPERNDRYREMARQLEALGMPFQPGKVEVFSAVRPAAAAGFPGIGAHGCFLSHLGVLRDARGRGVESVLVMEDDLDIPPSDVPRLNRLMDDLRGREWGVIHLGHRLELPEIQEPRLIPFDGPVMTAHLYAVHRSVFDGLIEYLEGCLVRPPGDPVGGPMHYDGALTMYRAAHPEVVTLVARPSLAGQRSSASDITTGRLDRSPGLRAAMGLARKIKRMLRT